MPLAIGVNFLAQPSSSYKLFKRFFFLEGKVLTMCGSTIIPRTYLPI